jgi:thiamine-phosphate pyrophosphorylase
MIIDIEKSSQAIVEKHAKAMGVDGWTPRRLPAQVPETPVEQAVQMACVHLGFDDIDARVLGRAWLTQSERLGRFDPDLWPEDRRDFEMLPWPRREAFPACPRELGLYAVLPDATWVGVMARAGVPTVQLRFKSSDPQAIAREVSAAVAAVQGTACLLFINDHWQNAISAGAYGVHLGQEDLDKLSADDLRTLQTSGLRLGLSTHGYSEMVRADRFSPSYIALGAVFPTTLKRMATAAQGTGRLKRYAHLMSPYSLVAIGGIDADRMPAVVASGVGSVAVVRAIVGAANPEAAARALIDQLAHLRAHRVDT